MSFTKFEVLSVGNALVYETAGKDDIAREIFENPQLHREPPVLGVLAKAWTKDEGASLTTEEMRNVASEIKTETSNTYLGVGGQDQVAFLTSGKVLRIEQERIPQLRSPLEFSVMERVNIFRSGTDSPFPTISIASSFTECQVQLDSNYFFGDYFDKVNFLYDGGVFSLNEKENSFNDIWLVLGPHVTADSPQVQDLVRRFNFARVVKQKP
jgi:hypothetical protein